MVLYMGFFLVFHTLLNSIKMFYPYINLLSKLHLHYEILILNYLIHNSTLIYVSLLKNYYLYMKNLIIYSLYLYLLFLSYYIIDLFYVNPYMIYLHKSIIYFHVNYILLLFHLNHNYTLYQMYQITDKLYNLLLMI